MLGQTVKRAVEVVVLGLALLAFFTVPVGKKTPAGHVVAIFRTEPAREAAAAFADTARQIVAQVRAELETEPPRDKPR